MSATSCAPGSELNRHEYACCGATSRVERDESHFAVVLEILGKVDRCHAAFAEAAFNLIATGKRYVETNFYLTQKGGTPIVRERLTISVPGASGHDS